MNYAFLAVDEMGIITINYRLVTLKNQHGLYCMVIKLWMQHFKGYAILTLLLLPPPCRKDTGSKNDGHSLKVSLQKSIQTCRIEQYII